MIDQWEATRKLARIATYLMEREERDFDALDIVVWAMWRSGMEAARPSINE
jgi:hypothetical protein